MFFQVEPKGAPYFVVEFANEERIASQSVTKDASAVWRVTCRGESLNKFNLKRGYELAHVLCPEIFIG